MSAVNTLVRHTLAHSMDKLTESIHPNYRKALSAKALQQELQMRGAVKDSTSRNLSKWIKNTALALSDDSMVYVRFLKALASDARYQLGFELRNTQAGTVQNIEDVLAGAPDDFDEPPVNFDDIAGADVSDAVHQLGEEAVREDMTDPQYNENEVLAAADYIQAWLSAFVSRFTPNQLDFFGLPSGLIPWCVKDESDGYEPITDFTDALDYEQARWKKNQRMVKPVEVPDLVD